MFQTTNQPICWYAQQLYFLNPHTIDDRPDVFFSFLLGFEVVRATESGQEERGHTLILSVFTVFRAFRWSEQSTGLTMCMILVSARRGP